MPRFLAVTGIIVFAAISLVASLTRSPGRVSDVTRAGERPIATADPAVTTRVAPDVDHGRLAPGDREVRRRIVIRGLVRPIEGAAVPTDPQLLPNAARDFRAGWHEGVDFPAPPGTPVLAVAAGVIVRIDRDFVDWDRQTREIALFEAVQLGYTPAVTLDRIRGRQVWIDHGRGIVSRYAHLSAVADRVVGETVEPGTAIGQVGSSGYPEGGPHLHLEIRIGSSYLGDGLSGEALLAVISAAFE